MSNAEPEPLSVHLIYDLAVKRLDAQMEQIDAIDTKVNVAFGFASLAIGVAGGFVGTAHSGPSPASTALLFSALTVYVLVIVLALGGYMFRQFEYAPRVKQVWQDALFWDPVATKRQAVSSIVEAIETNKQRIAEKVQLGRAALILLGVEVILITFSLFFV
jgi:hypothetical protein